MGVKADGAELVFNGGFLPARNAADAMPTTHSGGFVNQALTEELKHQLHALAARVEKLEMEAAGIATGEP